MIPSIRHGSRGAVALAAVVAVCLLGCRKREEVKEAGGLYPVTMQLDWYPQPEQGGFFDALLKGYYKAEGLDVKLAPGGPFIVAEQQVSSGAMQFAQGASDQLLVDASRGLPVVAVAATMQKDPQGIMVHAESSIHSFADLNGHAVAVKPGSDWFQYLVKRFKLGNVREIPATYSVANFLQDPNYIQQAFVTSEPYFAAKGGAPARVLLNSDAGYHPYRLFFTSRQFLADHPEIVAKFVRASLKGWQDFLADPAAVDAEIAKLNPAQNPEQMAFSVKTLKEGHFITGDDGKDLGKFSPERWAETYNQLLELGLIAQPLDPKTVYTLQFQPQGTGIRD